MINGEKVLAIIPARGGSVSLPRKNILPLGGLPLIVHTIRQVKLSKYVDKFICSTDDKEIKKIAEDNGCQVPFLRPKYLSKNTTTSQEVLFNICKKITNYNYVVLLQPTSPLRMTKDIDKTIELCDQYNASSSVTVSQANKNPQWMYYLNKKNLLKPVLSQKNIKTRRQDLPDTYILNGAVYVLKYNNIIADKPFISDDTVVNIMPIERSIDIDTALDLKIANIIYKDN